MVLAEAVQEIAPILDNLDEETDRAYARKLDHVRLLTRLRGKKLLTERHHTMRQPFRLPLNQTPVDPGPLWTRVQPLR